MSEFCEINEQIIQKISGKRDQVDKNDPLDSKNDMTQSDFVKKKVKTIFNSLN